MSPRSSNKKARPTAKNSRGKSKKKSRRAEKSVVLGKITTMKRSKAPVAISHLRTGMNFQFGRAPYEENFGYGARIQAHICGAGIGRSSAAAANRILLLNNSSGLVYDAVAKAIPSTYNSSEHWHSFMGQNTEIMTPIQALVELFSMYVVRRCVMHYRPSVGTTTNGTIVFGVTKQYQEALPEETTFVAIQSLPQSVATPVWKECSLVIVGDKKKQAGAAKLYETVYKSGTQIQNQFNLLAAVDVNIASGSDFLGFIDFDVEIDLYGMRGVTQSNATVSRDLAVTGTTSVERKEAKERKEVKIEEDYVTVLSQSSSGAVTSAFPTFRSSGLQQVRKVSSDAKVSTKDGPN